MEHEIQYKRVNRVFIRAESLRCNREIANSRINIEYSRRLSLNFWPGEIVVRHLSIRVVSFSNRRFLRPPCFLSASRVANLGDFTRQTFTRHPVIRIREPPLYGTFVQHFFFLFRLFYLSFLFALASIFYFCLLPFLALARQTVQFWHIIYFTLIVQLQK